MMEKTKHQVQNLRDRHHRVSMKYFELKHKMEKAKKLKDALETKVVLKFEELLA